MYEFQPYNSAQPQIITSFKGNQKLILGGYRYNIHHVKEGVKTWRCVCAKKLTGARSWCKGRAETWDGDSKGIPKGEHNHQTEHDLAELEFFKSQLIFAAIADLQADLNVLVEEAAAFLSPGLSFGNRESMKKSLIVARKSAETGELKLGQQPHRSTMKGARKGCGTGVRSSKNMHSSSTHLSAAANGQKKTAQGAKDKNNPITISTRKTATSKLSGATNIPNTSATSVVVSSSSPNTLSNSFLFNTSATSSNNSSGLGSSLGELSMDLTAQCQLQQFDLSNSLGNLLDATDFAAAAAAAGIANGTMSTSTSYGGVNYTGTSTNEQLLAAALFAAAMFGSTATQGTDSQQNQQLQHTTNGVKSSPSTSKRTSIGTRSRIAGTNHQPAMAAPTSTVTNSNNNIAGTFLTQSEAAKPLLTAENSSSVKRKSARVNGILQKLSNKAAAISPSPPPLLMPSTLVCSKSITPHNELKSNVQQLLINAETQTDEAVEDVAPNNKRKRPHQKEDCDKMEENCGYKHDKNHQVLQSDQNEQSTCYYRPKVICCCCCEDIQDLKLSDMPIGCKKRIKFESVAEEQKEPMKEVKAEIKEDNNNATNIEDEKEEGEVDDDEGNACEEIKSVDIEDGGVELELFEMETDLKLEIAEDNDEDEEEERERVEEVEVDLQLADVKNKKVLLVNYDDENEEGELKDLAERDFDKK